jgi:tetratricopeptide (TPR) repeat protein
MSIRTYRAITIAIVLLIFGATAHADTYSTFETTRYYSANNRYFVKVLPNKNATLYRRDRRLQQVWSGELPELPGQLFVANDGRRVVMIDNYYGNGGSTTAKVVLFFNGRGNLIASHALGEVANLPHVLRTTSAAHWYYGSLFTPDQSTLIVETTVQKCEGPWRHAQTPEEMEAQEECWKPQPYEELRFSMATGKVISRADIKSKYTDPEKRLLHELELVENAQPFDNLNLAEAIVELAHFYQGQKQYANARNFYERGIPIYGKALGLGFPSVAKVVGDAATNYRNLGDYRHAEQLYRRALNALDRKQGNLKSVYPATITVYEDFALLLNKTNRHEEADRMEKRAKLLRVIYPDYRTAATH